MGLLRCGFRFRYLYILFPGIVLFMDLPGMGEALESCDDVTGFISCPDGHTKVPLRDSCQRVECPSCFMDWCRKAGHRISERLRGVRAAYYETRRSEYPKVRSFRHIIFSPPQGALSEGCDFDEAYGLFRSMFNAYRPLHGGSVVFHPYRLTEDARRGLAAYVRARAEDGDDDSFYARGGFWALAREDVLHLGSFQAYFTWGPHFHVLGFGFVPPADKFFKETGWVYVNLKDRNPKIVKDEKSGCICDQVELTARYQLSHAGVERGPSGKYRNSYRWFGIADSKHCKLVRTDRGTDVVRLIVDSVLRCPVCGSYLTASTDCITGDVVLRTEWLALLHDHGIGAVFVRKVYRKFEVIEDV